MAGDYRKAKWRHLNSRQLGHGPYWALSNARLLFNTPEQVYAFLKILQPVAEQFNNARQGTALPRYFRPRDRNWVLKNVPFFPFGERGAKQKSTISNL